MRFCGFFSGTKLKFKCGRDVQAAEEESGADWGRLVAASTRAHAHTLTHDATWGHQRCVYISGSFCIFLNHNYSVTIINDSVLFNPFHKEQHDSFRVTVADRGFGHFSLKFHTHIIGFSFMLQYLLHSVLHKMVSGRENSMSSNDTHNFPELIRPTWAHMSAGSGASLGTSTFKRQRAEPASARPSGNQI